MIVHRRAVSSCIFLCVGFVEGESIHIINIFDNKISASSFERIKNSLTNKLNKRQDALYVNGEKKTDEKLMLVVNIRG